MRTLANQPKPFYLIFLIEIWERLGFYGVQALLVLYMVQQLGFTDAHADQLYSAFIALVFLLTCVGGYVGDHILGTKRTILLGAFTLALGYFLLSLEAFHDANRLILPLAVIAVGNSLFKANPSSLLSKVYQGTSYNLDSGFTLYYMAINIGSFISMNLTPILNKYFGWSVAFFVCFLGLVVAILNFILMSHTVKNYGSEPDHRPVRWDRFVYVSISAVLFILTCYFLLTYYHIVAWLLFLGAIILLLIYLQLINKAQPQERKGMFLFIILFIQAIIFFTLYFQMPMSLTLFALRNVEHSIFGIPIQPAQFYMFNPFWVLLLSPVLAMIYQALSNRHRDISMPSKFSLGTLLAGLAFLILPLGGIFAHDGVISGIWLVISYGLQSVGELLVSALGLSLAARYVPQRFMGFSMGLWFLSTSIASIFAGKIASFANVPENISKDPILSLSIYNHVFLNIGIVTMIIALLMFALVPVLKKLAAAHHRVKMPDSLLVEDLITEK